MITRGKRQELFNKVIAHLTEQNARAVARNGDSCRYRSAAGLKCAIGCLIPDELYDPSIEGMGVTPLLFGMEDPRHMNFVKILRRVTGMETEADAEFLGHLQDLHDIESYWTNGNFNRDKAVAYMMRLHTYLKETPKE